MFYVFIYIILFIVINRFFIKKIKTQFNNYLNYIDNNNNSNNNQDENENTKSYQNQGLFNSTKKQSILVLKELLKERKKKKTLIKYLIEKID